MFSKELHLSIILSCFPPLVKAKCRNSTRRYGRCCFCSISPCYSWSSGCGSSSRICSTRSLIFRACPWSPAVHYRIWLYWILWIQKHILWRLKGKLHWIQILWQRWYHDWKQRYAGLLSGICKKRSQWIRFGFILLYQLRNQQPWWNRARRSNHWLWKTCRKAWPRSSPCPTAAWRWYASL